MMEEAKYKERFVQSDHDLLIRVEYKVDGLINEVREIQDGIRAQLTNHELRLVAIEKLRDTCDVSENIIKIKELYQWKHDFGLTWKLVVSVASVIGAVASAVISIVFKELHLLQ